MPAFEVYMFLSTPRNEEFDCCNSADQLAFPRYASTTPKTINHRSHIPIPWKLERLALPK